MQTGIDFGKTEARSMDLRDYLNKEGLFECKCVSAKWERSSNKHTLTLVLVWEVGEGEDKGKLAVERKYFTEKNAPYLKGWSEGVMNVKLPNERVNPGVYVNRFARVKGKLREVYNDKEYYEFQSFRSEDYFGYNKPVAGDYGVDVNETIDSVPIVQSSSSGNGDDTAPTPGDEDLPF